MADSIATVLNAFMRKSVRLSPQDEDSAQAFIADYFTSAVSESDDDLTGIMNFNMIAC